VDGRNVNAWHWTERDCTKWFKQHLEKELANLDLCELGHCKTKSVEKVEGEMTYCNRKRKHMFFYEIEIRLKWEATINDKKISGQVRVPSLCDEEPLESMQIRVNCTAKSKEGDEIMNEIKKEAIPRLRTLLQKLLDETKEHFKEPLPDEGAVIAGKKASQVPEIEKKEDPKANSKTKTISMKLSFDSSPELLYQCLVDDQRLSFFTQSAAQMERKEGGRFSLFGGQITGTNVTLEENKKIVQKWRFQSWPAEHYSTVNIQLVPNDRTTVVTLEQTDVPSSDFERTKGGWEQFFWSRIRAAFGFQYRNL